MQLHFPTNLNLWYAWTDSDDGNAKRPGKRVVFALNGALLRKWRARAPPVGQIMQKFQVIERNPFLFACSFICVCLCDRVFAFIDLRTSVTSQFIPFLPYSLLFEVELFCSVGWCAIILFIVHHTSSVLVLQYHNAQQFPSAQNVLVRMDTGAPLYTV